MKDPAGVFTKLHEYLDERIFLGVWPRAAKELARRIEQGRSPQEAYDEVIRLLEET
jgi:hypothetical protein